MPVAVIAKVKQKSGSFKLIDGVDIDLTNAQTGGDYTFETIMFTAGGGAPTTTDGCTGPTKYEGTSNKVDYWALVFPDGAKKYAFWGPLVIPRNYPGGNVPVRFHWTAAAGAASAGVRWGIQLAARTDNQAIDQAWGTAEEVTDNLDGTPNLNCVMVSDEVDLSIGGSPSAGAVLFVRVYRDPAHAGDTLAADARLIAVTMRYPISKLTVA